MFTTCPKCALNLAVTAADLRVGQGYVRCGRCANVFNALIGLADDLVDGDEQAGAPTSARTAGDLAGLEAADGLSDELTADDADDRGVAAHDTPAGDLASESSGDSNGDSSSDSMIVEEMSVPGQQEDADNTTVQNVVLETPGEAADESPPEGTGTFETIVLEGDTILQTQEVVDEDVVDEQLKQISEQLGSGSNVDQASEPGGDLAGEFARDFSGDGAQTEEEKKRTRRGRGAGTVGCVALALVLAAQAVHHWRHELAATQLLAAPVTRLYAALDMPLEPSWDLRAYQVRRVGEGAARSAAGRNITLRATVHNTARREQPLPLLRVTLQDVFGNDIARRDVEPAEYLARAAPEARPRMLAPDQRIDAEVVVVDATKKAEGFELDACLRSAAGALQCAAEEPALAAR